MEYRLDDYTWPVSGTIEEELGVYMDESWDGKHVPIAAMPDWQSNKSESQLELERVERSIAAQVIERARIYQANKLHSFFVVLGLIGQHAAKQ